MAADGAAASLKPAAPSPAAAPTAAELAPQPQAGKLLPVQGSSAKIWDAMKAVQAASGGSSEYTGAAGAEAAAASDEVGQHASQR